MSHRQCHNRAYGESPAGSPARRLETHGEFFPALLRANGPRGSPDVWPAAPESALPRQEQRRAFAGWPPDCRGQTERRTKHACTDVMLLFKGTVKHARVAKRTLHDAV